MCRRYDAICCTFQELGLHFADLEIQENLLGARSLTQKEKKAYVKRWALAPI